MKPRTPASTVILYIFAVIFLAVSAYMLYTAIEFQKLYLESLDAKLADMWQNVALYIIENFIPYFGIAVLTFGIGKAISVFAKGRQQIVVPDETDGVFDEESPIAIKLEEMRQVNGIKLEEMERREKVRLEETKEIILSDIELYRLQREEAENALMQKLATLVARTEPGKDIAISESEADVNEETAVADEVIDEPTEEIPAIEPEETEASEAEDLSETEETSESEEIVTDETEADEAEADEIKEEETEEAEEAETETEEPEEAGEETEEPEEAGEETEEAETETEEPAADEESEEAEEPENSEEAEETEGAEEPEEVRETEESEEPEATEEPKTTEESEAPEEPDEAAGEPEAAEDKDAETSDNGDGDSSEKDPAKWDDKKENLKILGPVKQHRRKKKGRK